MDTIVVQVVLLILQDPRYPGSCGVLVVDLFFVHTKLSRLHQACTKGEQFERRVPKILYDHDNDVLQTHTCFADDPVPIFLVLVQVSFHLTIPLAIICCC
jgi:hypothetical protein